MSIAVAQETLIPEATHPLELVPPILESDYYSVREQASNVRKIAGEQLRNVQEDVRSWLEGTGYLDIPSSHEDRVAYYTTFSRDAINAKLGGLATYIENNFSEQVSHAEIEATRLFVENAFNEYTFKQGAEELKTQPMDGSFAFIVPARMSRKHTEYGEEVEPVIPLLRYVPNELRSQMMVGLPPFVIDRYQRDQDGKRGYLIYAPVCEDMKYDLTEYASSSEFVRIARANVNATVDFAQRSFGITTVGLGAILPSVTNYGRSITNEQVTTTTGHGGTSKLVEMTVQSQMGGEVPKSIGIIGLGAMGKPIAEMTQKKYPDAKISVYDARKASSEKFCEEHAGFNPTASIAELIARSEIVVAAVTNPIDLRSEGLDNLDGTLIIDDSQPGSFAPEQVREYGGDILWVIGSDTNGDVATRDGYNYASLVDPRSDVFGCEAEVASIYKYASELAGRGTPDASIKRIIERIAIRSALTTQQATYIGALFKKYGIAAAKPQAFGVAVSIG